MLSRLAGAKQTCDELRSFYGGMFSHDVTSLYLWFHL